MSEAELRALSHDELVRLVLRHQHPPAEVAASADITRSALGKRDREALSDNVTADHDSTDGKEEEVTSPVKKKVKSKKEFDMSRYHQRYIILKLAYLGWQYDGLAAQTDTDNTIESHLLAALKRVRLITDRQSANYNRSGRTDKGVSALGNAVSVIVRSNLTPIDPLTDVGTKRIIYADTPLDISDPKKEELPYVKMINSALPPDIQVLAWAAIPEDFSARFSTKHRTYRYFFLGENLDIEKMRIAAKKLEGEHDYTNFCKMDVVNVHNFVRTIHSFDIYPAITSTIPGMREGSLYTMVICGQAFLWHQVRMMAAVLFLVGSGQEDPSVVDELLDVSKTVGRPHYQMASEIPLVFWEASYNDVEWRYDAGALSNVHKAWSDRWKWLTIQTAVVHSYIAFIEDRPVTFQGEELKWKEFADVHPLKQPKHTPLLARGKGETYEARVSRLSGRKKTRYAKTTGSEVSGNETTSTDGEKGLADNAPPLASE